MSSTQAFISGANQAGEDNRNVARGGQGHHHLGASGARLATAAVNRLQATGGRHALATMCIGIGQGIAVILERVRGPAAERATIMAATHPKPGPRATLREIR